MLITLAVTIDVGENFLDFNDEVDLEFYQQVLKGGFILTSLWTYSEIGEVVTVEELKNYGTVEKI